MYAWYQLHAMSSTCSKNEEIGGERTIGEHSGGADVVGVEQLCQPLPLLSRNLCIQTSNLIRVSIAGASALAWLHDCSSPGAMPLQSAVLPGLPRQQLHFTNAVPSAAKHTHSAGHRVFGEVNACTPVTGFCRMAQHSALEKHGPL